MSLLLEMQYTKDFSNAEPTDYECYTELLDQYFSVTHYSYCRYSTDILRAGWLIIWSAQNRCSFLVL